MKLIDLTGQKFGHLTVIKRGTDYISPKGAISVRWLCKCDCGNYHEVISKVLRDGSAQSCGCQKRGKRKENEYVIKDGVAYVQIGNSTVKIDEADLPIIKKEGWHINKKNGYVYSNKEKKTLHRLIMNPTEGKVVDHINKDRLDNRRCNLREVDYSTNGINKELIPGKSGEFFITYNSSNNYYSVYVDKKYYGGSYDLEKAVKIRDEAIKDSRVLANNFKLQMKLNGQSFI